MTSRGSAYSRYAVVTVGMPTSPRRTIDSSFESSSALDLRAVVEVESVEFPGVVTLHDPYPGGPEGRSGRWAPCRSVHSSRGPVEYRWIHGKVLQGVERASQIAGGRSADVRRALILALAGCWPDQVWWFRTGVAQPLIACTVDLGSAAVTVVDRSAGPRIIPAGGRAP